MYQPFVISIRTKKSDEKEYHFKKYINLKHYDK